jgi:hypothetical protein
VIRPFLPRLRREIDEHAQQARARPVRIDEVVAQATTVFSMLRLQGVQTAAKHAPSDATFAKKKMGICPSFLSFNPTR